MKLKTLLVLLAFLITAIIGALSGLAYVSIGSLTDSLASNATNAKSYTTLLNETRTAQVAFQIQVQEWKNILIRGNDKELYAKHLKGFNDQERSMDETLNSMRSSMVSGNIDIGNIDSLLAAHASLGVKYRDALKTWNPEDELTGKAVDKLLRGIDRPTSAALSDFAAQIEKESIVNLSLSSGKAVARSKASVVTFLSVAAGSLAAALLVCVAVGRNVLDKIGCEPADLSHAFSSIAQGDLSIPIYVNSGENESLAARAALMQMRVRSMLRAITNGAHELERSTDKIAAATSVDAVSEAIFQSRQAVKGLLDASNRFKV